MSQTAILNLTRSSSALTSDTSNTTTTTGTTQVPFLKTISETHDPPAYRERSKQISDSIDALIAQDRAYRKSRKDAGDFSLLLLGQSESGKSTLLKQFQLMHSGHSFNAERMNWVPVILLNVLNTARNVVHILKEDPSDSVSSILAAKQGDLARSFNSVDGNAGTLLRCEEQLIKILVSCGHVQSSSPSPSSSSSSSTLSTSPKSVYIRRRHHQSSSQSQGQDQSQQFQPLTEEDLSTLSSISETLNALSPDIYILWTHSAVQRVVRERLQEDWRAYYIDHLPRITSKSYIPTDADILHVRIMTLGVIEHSFRISTVSSGTGSSQGTGTGSTRSINPFRKDEAKDVNMKIYDVGGARGQRHAWASFFEDANAIIFLAPISAFDQFLTEEPSVNRIRDSIELFSKICDNPLLGSVQLVLFLNKIDILEQKLNDGIKIKDYIPSYGDQPNNLKTAKKYFATHFNSIFAKSKVNTNNLKRGIFIHFTSVVDTKATQVVIGNVQDAVLRAQLKDARLM